MGFFKTAHRSLFRFCLNPVFSFIFYLLLIALLVLSSDKSTALGLLVFFLPWLLIIVFVFNIPFIAATFRLFKMDETRKRNHAVEHGTIYFIKELYGRGARVGGRADYDGFRVSGIKRPKDIRDAFKRMADCYGRGKRDEIIAISRACGSNVVTAQGFGMVLLTITGIVSPALKLNTTVSLLLLGLNIALYFLLRHRVGNWIQRRFFISLDFEDVRIEWIRSVPKKFFERNYTYFVKTRFS